MRILFDQGVRGMRNKGNIALLQAALERLGGLWPSASLEVISSEPHLLKLYWPGAQPVSPDGRYDWSGAGRRERVHRLIPRPALRLLFEAREEAWHRSPALAQLRAHAAISTPAIHPDGPAGLPPQAIGEAAREATDTSMLRGVDLFVATGAQYMSDACRDDALQVLDRLEAAARLRVPTAMLGQGLGPIRDAELRARSAAVLPLVDLIFVRERLTAPKLLASLGVDPARVVMTGDDAVEMVYRARTGTLGTAIGFSMRRAPYTGVRDGGEDSLSPLRLALQRASERHAARLVGFPISHSAHETDDVTIGRLLAGLGNVSTRRWRFDSPLEIIRAVGHCRLVVTGTFHAAVFALAQGIPAVCLARSAMYMEKFAGLADQFGPGCRVICLDDAHLLEVLSGAVEAAWDSAERVRPHLLEAAARQVELGRAAYRRLYELVTASSRAS